MDQADNDFFVFAELVKDYITLIGAVKVCTIGLNICKDHTQSLLGGGG